MSRARKHWLGWGAVFVIAVALGAVGVGHPLDWGIIVIVMAIFGYGLAALLRISLGFGLVLAVVAIVLGMPKSRRAGRSVTGSRKGR